MTTKQCIKCKKIKFIAEFLKSISTESGYGPKCKECYNEYQREYRKKKNTALEYYYRNQAKCQEKSRNYSKTNRETRNEIQRIWRKKQRETNPSWKAWENARKRIWKVMNVKKQTSTDKLIGTTPIMFKLWLEYTFSEKMNWNNYGTYWHIEHVIPLATFDITQNDQVLNAFNWKNCRAETKKFNLKKQNNIIQEQVDNQDRDLKHFMQIRNFKQSLKSEIRSQASFKEEEGSTTRQ